MKHEPTTMKKIHRASDQRQENWSAHPLTDPMTTKEITDNLHDLWAQYRLERARTRHGDRAIIIKRSRVERELERLMREDNLKPR